MSVTKLATNVQLAAEYDAAGRHDEAVDALARAAGRGDLEALTQLGKRLIVGDRAPLLPREGCGFLVDALNAGGAEAPLRLASLAALGAYMAQSWNTALGLLVTAADRGSKSARRQLALLSSDSVLARTAANAPESSPGLWRALGESIDMAAWSTPTQGLAVHAEPTIQAFPAFTSEEICAWLITRARGKLKRALVYDAVSARDIADHSRTNTVAEFNLVETDLVQAATQVRMSALCGIAVVNMEAPAVLHYEVGQEIVDHYDFIDPETPNYERQIAERGERVITFLVYLNDDYAGGETDFPRLNVSHKGSVGEGLYFVNSLPEGGPDRRMLHAGRPPTRGEKWVVSQFIRNRTALPVAAR
ncbi:MAG TPA: 2OG-Fe(II) oxygenase [Gammaproteobacteria bacterium]|nr:2OG-Fe(II) oxygenase [Gammaproteobacteria bacterium]